jgi:hypothetical protein
MESGMTQKPLLDLRRLVGRDVVDDEVDVECFGG